MGEDAFDERDARGEVDAANHAILVAADIKDEHDQVFFCAGCIHAVEVCFEFRKVLWFDAAQVVVPVSQGFFGAGMVFGERPKGSWCDDVHAKIILQNVIIDKPKTEDGHTKSPSRVTWCVLRLYRNYFIIGQG